MPPITAPRFLPLLPPVPPQGGASQLPSRMFRPMAVAAGGLSAQRLRMEVAAQNIANAETTRTPEGGPYQRRVVALEALPTESPAAAFAGSPGLTMPGVAPAGAGDMLALLPTVPPADPDDAGGVRVAGITTDASPGPMVYDPGHPDADDKGYVRMPNVDLTAELVDLMEARRLYEANVSVFQAAKQMSRAAINL